MTSVVMTGRRMKSSEMFMTSASAPGPRPVTTSILRARREPQLAVRDDRSPGASPFAMTVPSAAVARDRHGPRLHRLSALTT